MAGLAYFRNNLLQDNDSFTIVKDESLGTEEKSQKDQVLTASKPLSYWYSSNSKVLEPCLLILGFPIPVIVQARSGSSESEAMLSIVDDTEEKS